MYENGLLIRAIIAWFWATRYIPLYLKRHSSKGQKFPESRFKMENCLEMDYLTSPELEKEANIASLNLLPEKSTVI